MKKIISFVLALFLAFITICNFRPVLVTNASENLKLTIHFNKTDNNYENWDLWFWDKTNNLEGKAITAQYRDDFGLIFEIDVKKDNEYGYIIRKNDWSSKNCSDDQFIKITADTEIWIQEGQCGFSKENMTNLAGDRVPLQQEEEIIDAGELKAKLYVHYYRFDQKYDGWNFWIWPSGSEGKNYEISSYDDYGAVAEVNLTNIGNNNEIGLIVRLNNWDAKDVDKDRYISFLASELKDNIYEKHIYLLEGEEKIFLNKNEVSKKPSIASANFVNLDEIELGLKTNILDKDGIEVFDEAGNKLLITKIEVKNQKLLIKLATKIQLGSTYYISKKGYSKPKEISYNGIFSTKEFEDQFYYEGNDLGFVYDKNKTSFKLWAPTATKVILNLYETGDYRKNDLIKSLEMKQAEKGVWSYLALEDLKGVYYTYSVTVNGETNEVVDPYAKAVGVNGHRAMVIDLDQSDPQGFDPFDKPSFSGNYVDALIYELHVRDLSSAINSNIKNKGKYLGLIETNTKNEQGHSTGLDHLKELGITHVHLLPVFDFLSVDETSLDQKQYNWGYDPYNYNVPEGSYSSDPYEGETRVNEFKQMVAGFHENGIRVIMDVVYNHTKESSNSHFNKIVPGYYYRTNDDGSFSNGSGCGNETASERKMMRKYIVDSVTYWAKEYGIDGFRFDLMALHDIETMNEVEKALHAIDETIIIYGEGWTGGSSLLPDDQKSLKTNVNKLNNIAVFSDDLRDGVKGSVFNVKETGFVSGNSANISKIKFGITGGAIINSVSPLYKVTSPAQTINYVSAHDNNTLWDKLVLSTDVDDEIRIKMDKMANAIVLTSQGVPFIHAGAEFLRSKDGNQNSYNAPDEINQLDWDLKSKNIDVFNYYKGLIELRKKYSAFRLNSIDKITNSLSFMNVEQNMIAYTITEDDQITLVAFNANDSVKEIQLPKGRFDVLVDGEKAGTKSLKTVSKTLKLEPYSSYVLVSKKDNGALIIGISLLLIFALSYLGFKKFKKNIK